MSAHAFGYSAAVEWASEDDLYMPTHYAGCFNPLAVTEMRVS